VLTALATPILFSTWSGHFRSSLVEKAVSSKGHPLPWYSYPCIDLLRFQDLAGRKVLEFGGGQSTLWWAARAERVITFECDLDWSSRLVKLLPGNVNLHFVPSNSKDAYLAEVRRKLIECDIRAFDVVVIDAEFREDLVSLALEVLTEDGALICDDAESYGIHVASRELAVQRVDFFGYSPGVVLPHCTSVFFRTKCFLFDAGRRIPDVAIER
jgi:hypothetical protein